MAIVRRILLVGAAVLAGLLLAAFVAGRVTAHDHGQYKRWFGQDGGPCCSDLGRECRPVQSYLDDDGRHRIMLDGRWVPVPASAVRPYRSPDGSSHACIGKGGAIFCFVNGVPKS